MPDKPNIVFIGMMGTFKTAVSAIVAKETGLPLYDTDTIFTERYGAIADFFDKEGEKAFRQREAEIVEEVAALAPAIISTGGGVVLSPRNMAILKHNGRVVQLSASAAAINSRVHGGRGRPLLKGDTMSNIVRILTERQPLYKRYADFTVDNTRLTPETCAQKVMQLLRI